MCGRVLQWRHIKLRHDFFSRIVPQALDSQIGLVRARRGRGLDSTSLGHLVVRALGNGVTAFGDLQIAALRDCIVAALGDCIVATLGHRIVRATLSHGVVGTAFGYCIVGTAFGYRVVCAALGDRVVAARWRRCELVLGAALGHLIGVAFVAIRRRGHCVCLLPAARTVLLPQGLLVHGQLAGAACLLYGIVSVNGFHLRAVGGLALAGAFQHL